MQLVFYLLLAKFLTRPFTFAMPLFIGKFKGILGLILRLYLSDNTSLTSNELLNLQYVLQVDGRTTISDDLSRYSVQSFK